MVFCLVIPGEISSLIRMQTSNCKWFIHDCSLPLFFLFKLARWVMQRFEFRCSLALSLSERQWRRHLVLLIAISVDAKFMKYFDRSQKIWRQSYYKFQNGHYFLPHQVQFKVEIFAQPLLYISLSESPLTAIEKKMLISRLFRPKLNFLDP